MKKQLLICTALLAILSANSQQSFKELKKQAQPVSLAAYLAQKYAHQSASAEKPMAPTNLNKAESTPEVQLPSSARSKSVTPPLSWKIFAASMNIFGTLVSTSEPLQYDDELNAVSFIHRKSVTYIADVVYDTDAENSGGMVGTFTQDWGNHWDSTLLWRDNNYYGRYPQGGIWAPPGDSILEHGQIIATGPTNGAASLWIGSFVASKALDSMGGAGNNNAPSPVGGATVYASNTAPFTALGKRLDFPRDGFAATDDGKVRSLGINIDAVDPNFSGPHGGALLVGKYDSNNAIFNWQIDTISPLVETTSAGAPHMLAEGNMAWSDDGKVGFVWFIGVRKHRPGMGDTLANNGYQPIVYKTVDSGATWTELPRMNFNNNPVMDPVMEHIFGVSNDTTNTLAIPFFLPLEGADGVVDRNGRLHIVTTVIGTFSSHPDSLNYFFQITLPSDGQAYHFGHRNLLRPYIYDFTETPTGWKCTVIDSMSSEGPSSVPGSNQNTNGYNDNPWDADPNNQNSKIEIDGRIQASRSKDGKYLVYTWAESDSANTTGGRKWNTIPNVKARLVTVGIETNTNTPATMTLHPNEINITSPQSAAPPYTVHPQVASNATNHYIANRMAVLSSPTSTGVALGLPITVSNSSPKRQLQPNRHWYFTANLNFDNVPQNQLTWPETKKKVKDTLGVADYDKTNIPSVIYPNPANGAASMKYSLDKATEVEIRVSNVVGQVIASFNQKAMQGENMVSLNTSQLESGLYTVHLQTRDSQSTLKLIVQH